VWQLTLVCVRVCACKLKVKPHCDRFRISVLIALYVLSIPINKQRFLFSRSGEQ